jgi:Fe-Mn family superoxide dismutase
MSSSTRRDFLQGTATYTLLAAAAATGAARAAEPGAAAATGNAAAGAAAASATSGIAAAPAWSAAHQPVPLPFEARSLKGISEKLIRSHHENNYTGAVKALNLVRSRLLAATADNAATPYLYAGLKREQLARTGSVVYHELYFANLGGSAPASSGLRSSLAHSFGSYDAWETEFRRIAAGLAGGSGWVVLAWNPTLRLFENYALWDHTMGMTGSHPVLVMDMYEHAFQMDYGAAAAMYIDAFFANINWETVAARLAVAAP